MTDPTILALFNAAPIVMALVAIVYWTSVVKPFLERLTNTLTGEADGLAGTDFTRVFVAVLSVGVSFLVAPLVPVISWQMTLLMGATFAAIADGSYTKILKKFQDEANDLTTTTKP